MAYVHGESLRRNPAAAIQSLGNSIEQARRHLAELDAHIETATRELTEIQRKAARARRQHAAYMRGRATDPDHFLDEAREAYEAAMSRYPEDAIQGRRRCRLLDRELAQAAREHQSGPTTHELSLAG